MPKIGLSRPYVAEYVNNGAGVIGYRGGRSLGRAVSSSLEVTTEEGNNFYSDNGISESAGGGMTGGALTIGTDHLSQENSALVLGLKSETLTINGKSVKVNKYNDDMRAPYFGFGEIEKHMVRNAIKWRPIILNKIQFNIPSEEANTQGESIEWLASSITAAVFKADDEKHTWQMDAWFDSESEADAFIRHVLNIKEGVLEERTVTSAAGTATGKTLLTVTPSLPDGRAYRYDTGADIEIPAYGQNLSAWKSWDGTSEIAAVTGDEIVMAEVDSSGAAMAAGLATVTAKA